MKAKTSGERDELGTHTLEDRWPGVAAFLRSEEALVAALQFARGRGNPDEMREKLRLVAAVAEALETSDPREQAVSWAYGQAALENPEVTREMALAAVRNERGEEGEDGASESEPSDPFSP